MDSSRGRSLTNLLLIIIVVGVPVLALFQPPEGSVLSRLLSAATGEQESTSEEPQPEDDLNDLFPDDALPDAPPAESMQLSEDDLRDELELDMQKQLANTASLYGAEIPPEIMSGRLEESPDGTADSEPGVADRLNYLKEMDKDGLLPANARLTRTRWFPVDGGHIVFAAFFSSHGGGPVYRFESLARTRAEAVQDVIDQVRDWQKE